MSIYLGETLISNSGASGGSGGTGDIVGPTSSTDNALARFDSTTGKVLQNGVITESDNGDIKLVNAIELDITPTALLDTEGVISWNTVDKTIDINQGNGVIQQVGQEQYWRGKNQTGSTINQPSVVYASGAIGVSGIMTISPFIANGSIPGMYTLGITTENILDGADGFITTFGKIRGINTTGGAEAWVEGDVLYVSPTTAGALTNVKPTLPNLVIPIAFVISVSATVGTIAVRVPTPTPMAEEISYDNAVSGLTAVEIQSAIDEIDNRVDNLETNNTGTNTGDQDLSGLALKSNVLELNNTTAFTPDNDYEPATKKYVDDNAGGSNPIFTTVIQGQIYTGTIDRFVAKGIQTIAGVKISLGSLPTGSNVSVDIRKNGTASTNSIFTSDTPISITTGQGATNGIYITTGTAIDNGTLAENDVLYVVITSVGSTLPGSDLEVIIY